MVVSQNTDKLSGKEKKYEQLVSQISFLIKEENDLIANLSNIVAALKYEMGFFWVGFYFVKPASGNFIKKNNNDFELVLGPFQGPVACTRIGFGKGVCGKCWAEKKTIIVDDVEKFPGHIACSSESKSEIVLPVFNSDKKVIMVLDIDSDVLSSFNLMDKKYLSEIISILETKPFISEKK